MPSNFKGPSCRSGFVLLILTWRIDCFHRRVRLIRMQARCAEVVEVNLMAKQFQQLSASMQLRTYTRIFWSNLDPGMPSQSGRHARVFQFLQHEDQDKMETDCSSRNQQWVGITAWSTVWLRFELKPSILQFLVQATKLQLVSSGLWFLVALAIPRELQERDKGRENVSTHYYVFHKTTILLQLVISNVSQFHHNLLFKSITSKQCLPGDLGSQSRTTVRGWPVGRPPRFHSRWNWSSYQCVNCEKKTSL